MFCFSWRKWISEMSRKQPKHYKKDSHPHPDEASGQQETRNDMDIRGSVEINRSPSLEKQHQAERFEDSARENKKDLIERIMLVAVVVYAFLTLLIYCASKKAADAATSAASTASQSLTDSRQSFRLENRPYVVIAAPGVPFFLKSTNGKASVIRLDLANINYTNIGKTPAADVFVLARFRPWRYHGQPSPEIPFIDEEFKHIDEDDAKVSQNYAGIPKADIAPQ